MSLDFKGMSCVRCKSYLFAEDDVVFCPICGAPHHRECYNALGHCALEELHGTPQEYSREAVLQAKEQAEEKQTEQTKVIKCEICGEEYNELQSRCPKCGTPDLKKVNGFVQIDLLGGVPADYDLGDGVTANDAKMFVASNTHRYIPKFAVLNKLNKFSWNWMAFFFPTGWMLSRKMYKGGIITGVFTVVATLLSYPLSLELYNMGFGQSEYGAEMIKSLAERIPQIGVAVIGLAMLGLVFELGVRFITAMLGDYIYKNHTVNSIKKIKSENEDVTQAYRKKGGVSMLWFLLGIMLMQYIPSILTLFLS